MWVVPVVILGADRCSSGGSRPGGDGSAPRGRFADSGGARRPALGWRTVAPAGPLCPGPHRIGGRSAHTELHAWKQTPLCPLRATGASTSDRGPSGANTSHSGSNPRESTICCGSRPRHPLRVPRPEPTVPRLSPTHPPTVHPAVRTNPVCPARRARIPKGSGRHADPVAVGRVPDASTRRSSWRTTPGSLRSTPSGGRWRRRPQRAGAQLR